MYTIAGAVLILRAVHRPRVKAGLNCAPDTVLATSVRAATATPAPSATKNE
jgi:uncharacterized membrane protein